MRFACHFRKLKMYLNFCGECTEKPASCVQILSENVFCNGQTSQTFSIGRCNQKSAGSSDKRFMDHEDDVVIVSALRTPICKSNRGGFKNALPDDLLAASFMAVIADADIDPASLQDVCIGNVGHPGTTGLYGRIAQFMSNIPETVPLLTISRFCSSGLQACIDIAAKIKAGYIDIGIGAGVESMTSIPVLWPPSGFFRNHNSYSIQKVEQQRKMLQTNLWITSEIVAEKYGISRLKQDEFACQSHAKAAKAQQDGLFEAEIIPVKVNLIDKDGKESHVLICRDDGIRPDTNLAALSKLKPAFKEGGSTTAGNSSQISDGAAAVILARRSHARKNNLPILGVLRSYAAVGVPPETMGIGPAYAIPMALSRVGLTVDDIDIFEINEAFASQAVYCIEELKIPMEKVNPKGGAIALGHPLGCTGARQICTLLHELKRKGKKSYGVVSMCVGTGMGVAAVFEYPGHQLSSRL